MKLWSDNFNDGEAFPAANAFGRPHRENHVELSGNKSPHLAWSDVPDGTKSLVLLCHDPDVPTSPETVNKEGMTVPADLPRMDFYHWVLVDLPPSVAALKEGEFSDGVTPRGKPSPGPHNTRQGLNNYTQWFEGDEDMAGTYFGYDGPCPPWNDEIVHHYHFALYALDLEKCPVEGEFTGQDVNQALVGHVLGKAVITATYAIFAGAKVRA